MIKTKTFISIACSVLLLSSLGLAYTQEDINATREYHEKYLKGKITPAVKGDIAKSIKLEELKSYKDFNLSDPSTTGGDIGDIEVSVKRAVSAGSDGAKAVKDWVSSKAYNNQFNDHTNYILKDQKIGGYAMPDYDLLKGEITGFQNQFNEHIYIVISSSMPIEQIQEYFRQVEGEEHITFVMRGFIGKGVRHFEPTRKYMERLLTKDPDGEMTQENKYNISLHINPKVTQRYGIDRVPAVIYVQNQDGTLEESVPLEESKETFWVSYGMGALDYVFERINKEAKSHWLTSLIEKDTFFSPKDKTKTN